MKELFDQHPPPWTDDDNRPGQEGTLNVYDANGEIIVSISDMEDCTYAEILFAKLMARAPDMYYALRYAVDNPDFDSEEFDRLARAALWPTADGQPA